MKTKASSATCALEYGLIPGQFGLTTKINELHVFIFIYLFVFVYLLKNLSKRFLTFFSSEETES